MRTRLAGRDLALSRMACRAVIPASGSGGGLLEGEAGRLGDEYGFGDGGVLGVGPRQP